MMNKACVFLFCSVVFSGCIKNPPQVPSVKIDQHHDVTAISEVCFDHDLEFDHYIFHGDESSDSIQWFAMYLWDTTFLGTGHSIDVPVSHAEYPGWVFRYEFNGSDTTYYTTGFGWCFRDLYVPNAFTPYYNNGINDIWKPILYNTDGSAVSMSWRILDPSGTLIFETDAVDGFWDGTYDGTHLYPGPFLYHITLNIPVEGTFEYSGVLSLLES